MNKVSTSWRLEARLEDIENYLNTNRVIVFNHVKRESNKVTDFLANVGVDSRHSLQTGTLGILQNDEQKKECTTLLQKDETPPDAGVRNEH